MTEIKTVNLEPRKRRYFFTWCMLHAACTVNQWNLLPAELVNESNVVAKILRRHRSYYNNQDILCSYASWYNSIRSFYLTLHSMSWLPVKIQTYFIPYMQDDIKIVVLLIQIVVHLPLPKVGGWPVELAVWFNR